MPFYLFIWEVVYLFLWNYIIFGCIILLLVVFNLLNSKQQAICYRSYFVFISTNGLALTSQLVIITYTTGKTCLNMPQTIEKESRDNCALLRLIADITFKTINNAFSFSVIHMYWSIALTWRANSPINHA